MAPVATAVFSLPSGRRSTVPVTCTQYSARSRCADSAAEPERNTTWAGVAWPKEFGGLGLSGLQQVIWYEELARAKAPHHINTTYVSMMHAGPTLIARGTDEQKAFHLPRILSGEKTAFLSFIFFVLEANSDFQRTTR